MNKKRVKIIVLAAGQGTRMGGNLPKVLEKVKGQPMIKHLLRRVWQAKVDPKPIIVVGHKKEKVKRALGKKYLYTIQKEQLGTGHAVMSAEKILKNKAEYIVVLYGDHPFVSPTTIQKLVGKTLDSGAKLILAVTVVPDFKSWRAFFYNNFSRIIRNKAGDIIKDVQVKDASEKEKKVRELNPCYYCFDAAWLWKNLKKLKTNNAQKQYYLTDLVQIAMKEKCKIESISISPKEALGANSKAELEILENLAI